jgi:peptidoglycan/LPS O-acetylase OafA/YrhL
MAVLSNEKLNFLFNEPSHERFKALDGIRALSCIVIVMFHCAFSTVALFGDAQSFVDYLSSLPKLFFYILKGDIALEMFFVFSAYLLSVQLFNEYKTAQKIHLKWYFFKRCLRIYPLYIFLLALTAIPLFILHGLNGSHVNVWANLLGVNNLYKTDQLFLIWTWSIAMELQFYLVCPFLVILAIKRPRLFFISMFIIFLGSGLWRYYHLIAGGFTSKTTMMESMLTFDKDAANYYMKNIYLHSISRIPPFLCGLLAGYCLVYQQALIQRIKDDKVLLCLLTALSLILCCWSWGGMNMRFMDSEMLERTNLWSWYIFEMVNFRLLFSIGLSLLILLMAHNVFSVSWLNRFFSFKGFYPISQMTYSIYLFSQFFMWIPIFIFRKLDLFQADAIGGLLFAVPITFFLSTLFAIVTFYFIEYPFLRGTIYQRVRSVIVHK